MVRLYSGAVVLVLVAGAVSPAFAACVSKTCPDAALIERARVTLQQSCGCMQAGQSHRAYMKCVRRVLDTTKEPAMLLDRSCRNAVVRCESKSICGQPDAVVCCKVRKLGTIVASMRKPAAQCKKGNPCGGALGLYSTFDACNPTGGCAAGVAATTTTSTTTTTLVPPPLTPLSNCEASRDAFEATLPVPTPLPGRYVVQLVNESDVTLLASANAAHQVGQPPFPVLPREGTWVIEPRGVLTIDIPPEWEHTIGATAQSPVFWARTGCNYDIEHDLAQCETGGCGVAYDCSKANRSPPGPKSLAEWTFNDDNHNAAPDISVVDGVNLNMDIAPLGPRTVHNPSNARWLDHSLVSCGGDQRDALWCPASFRLTRSELAMFPQGSPGGDDVVGCFSNCGRYKYPVEPDLHCTPDPATDPRCYYWKSFCCAFPVDGTSPYDGPCMSTSQCTQNGGCWNNGVKMFCACRAFNLLPDCPPNQCTFPYSQNIANQPPSACAATSPTRRATPARASVTTRSTT